MKTIVLFGFVLSALSAAGEVIIVKPGQKANFQCGVNSYRGTLTWNYQNNLIVSIDGKSGFSRKGTSNIASRAKVKNTALEISEVKEEDVGTFTCLADRNSQSHTLLVVSVTATPAGELHSGNDATLKCQVKSHLGLLKVQWKSPDGSQSESPAELKPVTSSHAGTWACMFSYEGKSYNISLGIIVKEPATTTNAPKVSSKSPKHTHKTSCVGCTSPGSSDLLGLKWWMWVIIGVGSLIVILLIIFVVCMCKRIKRKKRRLLKMRNSRQPPTNPYCQCNRPTAAAKPQQGRRREKPSGLHAASLSNGMI